MERLNRREFIHGAVSTGAIAFGAGASWLGCRPATIADPGPSGAEPPAAPIAPAPTSASQDALEEALGLMKDTGPEYQGRAANHGPMTAEALCVLGRPDAAVAWVEKYRQSLRDVPASRDPIDPAAWQQALGAHDRMGDWLAFFERIVAEGPWTEALDTWVARLAPGLAAGATHGIIRVGHAARALAARDTKLRRRELAHGLGYWAASYQPLPEARGPAKEAPKGASISDALARVETFHPTRPAPRGNIIAALDALAGWPSFAGVADLADTSIAPSDFISDLTEAFARVYLDNSAHHTIAFVHAVTGPSALRLLAPHLRPETTRAGLRYAWQTAAGLYAAYAVPARRDAGDAPGDLNELVDRAIRTGDEHAIKLTEACAREHALRPSPVFLAAAKDAIEKLG